MSLRVLIVDDDERFRSVARRSLESEGIEVVAEVENGAATFAAVLQWRPDVVLLDLGLPDMDGAEVARQLSAEPGPTVILISTRDAQYGNRIAVGLAAGYVPKDDLSLAAIEGLIGAAPLESA
ncbi:response regulator transcription factor [Jatrophihabitans sp.]|uniref:response regulator transcription factor n=1 Tax=Jatrophihabitans sp. TaxID=1932789 RepID=UPI0030C6CA77